MQRQQTDQRPGPRWRLGLPSNAPTIAILMGILSVLILAPVGFMFYGSVREGMFAAEGGYSLRALEEVYTSWPYLRTLIGTMLMALLIAALASAFGGLLAWLLARTDMPGRRWLEIAVISPLFLSPFIGAIAWITLAAPNSGILNIAARTLFGMEGHLVNIMNFPGIIWVLTLYYTPYGFIFISAALKNMDPSLEEASNINGAGVITTLRRVTFPIVWPALASTFFFVAILATGVFSVPGVLAASGGFVPMAVRLYRSVSLMPVDYAVAAAIGTLIFWITILGVFLYRYSVRLQHRYVTITARGFRQRAVPLRKWGWVATTVCVGYVVVSVVLPYAALILVALTPYLQTNLWEMTFTLSNFTAVLTSPSVIEATRNTLIIAVAAPTVCLVIATVTAFVTQRYKNRATTILDYIGTLPVAIPGIVFATGMIWAYIRTPLYGTLAILVIAYVAQYMPYALRLTGNGLMQIDRSLEEASTLCGAPQRTTLRRIVLPLTKPAILSAWIMIFIFTIREINTAILLYNPRSSILSVMTWDYVQDGSIRRAAVVGLLQTVLLVGGILIARFALRVRLSSQV